MPASLTLTLDGSFDVRDDLPSDRRLRTVCASGDLSTLYLMDVTGGIISFDTASETYTQLYPSGTFSDTEHDIKLSGDGTTLYVGKKAGTVSSLLSVAADGSSPSPTVVTTWTFTGRGRPRYGHYDTANDRYYVSGGTTRSLHYFEMANPQNAKQVAQPIGHDTVVHAIGPWHGAGEGMVCTIGGSHLAVYLYEFESGRFVAKVGDGASTAPSDGADRFETGLSNSVYVDSDSAGRVLFNSGNALWLCDLDGKVYDLNAVTGTNGGAVYNETAGKLWTSDGNVLLRSYTVTTL
ncbi:MAG: hypothetical protein ROR55_15910 [Devosia sp.]